MKILSADMLFSSSATLNRTTEETIYKLDAGRDDHHDERSIVTEQRATASAYFHTGEDYTVEIREEARNRAMHHEQRTREAAFNLDDNLERDMYLESVFSWAADTIDQFVTAFDAKENARQEQTTQRMESQNARTSGSLSETLAIPAAGNNSWENHLQLYRSMASELRARAEALRPSASEDGSANRIRRTVESEKEETLVQAAGVIHTADGREIGFSLDIDMHHESRTEEVLAYRFTDPLVINFTGSAAQLSDEKMSFDLNSDGLDESVARLQSGSGFLALDLNNDGMINNGGELFGPSTGNGFQELALYDDDNNNWIDANDAIYEKLAVWMKDASQQDVIRKLSDTGIGAIHLGAVDSAFGLRNSASETVGQVASTGIALTEKGAAKTIQQVNLVA